MNLLLLGGTTEARELAAALVAVGAPVVTSLAGGVRDPVLPPGRVRVGGFGGVDGLVAHLRDNRVAAVVDATHPFAARMTGNAAAACARAAVPLVRLSRPSWAERPDAASWHWVDSLAAARRRAGRLGDTVFLALGRQGLGEFAGWTDRAVLVRVVDPPEVPVPPGWTVVRARGPFRRADEVDLLRRHAIEVVVAKDSGGPASAKLDAAAELGVAVVMVRRPPDPEGVPVVTSVAEAAGWLAGLDAAGGQRRRSR